MSDISSSQPASITHKITGANGQTANLFVVEVYGGTDKFVIDSDGDVTVTGNFTLTGSLAYTGEMAITGDTAATITCKITGASGQSADLLVVEDNNGTDYFKVGATGNATLTGNLTQTGNTAITGTLGVTGAATLPTITGPTALSGTLTHTGSVAQTGESAITGDTAATITLKVAGASGQSADILVVEQNDGTDKFKIAANGDLTHTGAQTLTGNIGLTGNITQTGSQTVTGEVQITGDTAGTITSKVTGASGQTADLFVVEQNDGTDVFKVDKDGYITKQFDPDAASYIVWKSGSTYYAKNGATGAVAYSGAAFSTVMQSVLDSLTGGGFVQILRGSYSVGATITLSYSSTRVEGEGESTVLTLADGVDGNMFSVASSKQFITFAEMKLDGNKANNAAGSGAYFNTTYMGRVAGVWITGFKEYGVHINDCNKVDVTEVSLIEYNDAGGVYNYKGDNCAVDGCVIELNGAFGVKITDGGVAGTGVGNSVTNTWFESSGTDIQTNHIYIDALCATVERNKLNGGSLGEDMIYLTARADYATVGKNYLSACAGGYSGIKIDSGCIGYVILPQVHAGATSISDSSGYGYVLDTYSSSIITETFRGKRIATPEATQTISAVTDTIGHGGRIVPITAASDYALTSNPMITDGSPGEIITVVNVGAAGTGVVTLRSISVAASNLVLGAPYRALAPGSSITLLAITTLGSSYWLELGYARYSSENSGTSVGTGAQQTIAHGLPSTPNRVFLSESTTGGALAYQSAAADATNIYITATNTKTYQWEAKVV